ncbi:MAG: site-specific DNA-methyltransferase, partial [Elusimicrobiota bacterium]
DAFEKPVKPESQITNMIWEILLKSGYDLNTKVEEKKVTGCDVFSVADSKMILALSKISEKAIKEITKLKPKKFICLDSLFSGNDQLKTNTVLQLKDAGIEFKTI